jgi:hypothetical protein
LRHAWETGTDADEPGGAALRGIRNALGPEWLANYRPTPPPPLSIRNVQDLVFATYGEHVGAGAIAFYPSAAALADVAAYSKNWQYGETFVYAESADRYAIAVQCAPDSCEMFLFSQHGYADVITAYRLGADRFADAITAAMDGDTPALHSALTSPTPGMDA